MLGAASDNSGAPARSYREQKHTAGDSLAVAAKLVRRRLRSVVGRRCLRTTVANGFLLGCQQIRQAAEDGLGLSGAVPVGRLAMCSRITESQACRSLVSPGGAIVGLGRK